MSDNFPIPQQPQPVTPPAEPHAVPESPPPAEPPRPPEDEDVHTLPKGVQRRLDRAVRQRHEAEARARVAEEELARLRTASPQQSTARTIPPTDETAPTIDKFDNIEDYVTAKAQWVARRQISEALAQNEQTVRAQRAQQEAQALNSSWQERVTAITAKYPDFEDVVGGSETPMTPAMGRAILESDVGPELVYWLAQNPAEAAKIAQLSPLRTVAALGRIEERLTAAPPPAPKVSKAPPPIEPVGSRAAVTKDPDAMSTDEWMAWRKKQLSSR